MRATGIQPTADRSRMLVFMPRPAMAVTRHQRDNSTAPPRRGSGAQPKLLIATMTKKATANHGRSGGRFPLSSASPRSRVTRAATMITGASMPTRTSLTRMAVSPASGDRL